MTQQQLGERLGINAQQIQKYETGANRISASRLWDIALALDADVRFFFEGLGDAEDRGTGQAEDLAVDREARALVRGYQAMPQAQRKLLLDLVRILGESGAEQSSPGSVDVARSRG